MNTFFTAKNLATMGGVLLSFILPHIFFDDDYEVIEGDYEEIKSPVEKDEPVETTTVITTTEEEI